jgi:hypothetical protein
MSGTSLHQIINNKGISTQAIELLNNMLKFDPNIRYTA